jgi:hypothetical protein
VRLKWTLERLAQGKWFKLTCKPPLAQQNTYYLNERVEAALTTFDDVATGDYMVRVVDSGYCIIIAVQSEIDALTLQLILPISGCYRGRVKLRREQRMAIAKRAA